MVDKFCCDCMYSRGDGVKQTCDSPKNSVDHVSMEKYLVTGEPQPVIKALLATSCVVMRQYEQHPSLKVDMCGPSGKWYEAKEIAIG